MKKNARGSRFPLRLLPVAIAGCFTAAAHALPQSPVVASGSATFNTAGNTLNVANTPNAVINWQSFSIGQNETTNFIQQSASSAVLNRVVTNNPSSLLGTLTSNGKVFLVNPAGILVGQGAVVNVAGLVASTLDISNQDFIAGRMSFAAAPNTTPGAVTNNGTITTPDGGSVYLLAPQVSNSGIITTPKGETLLAAGNTVQLVDTATPGVSVQITGSDGTATNLGQIIADTGRIGVVGALVNNGGTLNASSLTTQGGRIFLQASKSIALNSTSTISADGTQGGTVSAKVVDGSGNITGSLTGGGTISAQGDGAAGSGGFVETSAGRVNVNNLSVLTRGGEWLIDPQDFTIAATGGDETGAALSGALSSGDVVIESSGGATAGSGNINVNDAVSWSANTLTLTAANNVNINAVMTATGSASLAMNPATANGPDSAVLTGAVLVGLNGSGFTGRVDFSGTGTLSIGGNTYTVINSLGAQGSTTGTDLQGINGNLSGYYALGSNIDATSTSTWNSGAGFAPIKGTGSAPFTGIFNGLGHTISNLTINLPGNFAGNYAGLFGIVDTSGIISNVGLNGGSVAGNNYVGGLVGKNNGTISNSYATENVSGSGFFIGGLVGYDYNASHGTSINASYATGNVTGGSFVGGLVGSNYNTPINNSYSTGSVLGSGSSVGGLAGNNSNTSPINNSYSTGSVMGGSYVGGLVGSNQNTSPINNSYSTGSVTGTQFVGGLAGGNNSNISASHSTGSVTGQGSLVGGLAGENTGSISTSYSTGSVLGSGNFVGGLAGKNTGSISTSYETGSVAGASYVGGLVGVNYGTTGTILNSYAAGNVTGTQYVGGLAGQNGGQGTISYSYAAGSVTGASIVGGLVGLTTNGVIISSFWDTQTSGQSKSSGGTGAATSQMMTLSTFANAGWSISGAGGAGLTWRIYDGQTMPLLTGFLTPLNLTNATTTVTYNGTAQSASPVTLGSLPANVFGSGTATGTNVGTYGEYYSNQQGYDITGGGELVISPATLTVTGTQVYNGTTSFAGKNLTIAGVNGETFKATGSGTLSTADVQSNQELADVSGLALHAVGGDLLSNYQPLAVADTSVSVTPKALTVSGEKAGNKVYDGTTTATLSGGTLKGVVSGDTVTLTESGAFTSADAANKIAVTVSDSISGTSASNYTLVEPASIKANITPKTLTAAIINDPSKTYDGTTAAALVSGDYQITGLVGSDSLDVTKTSGKYNSANVSLATTITVSLASSDFTAGTGTLLSNYKLPKKATGAGQITPATLTFTANTVNIAAGSAIPKLSGTVTGFVGSQTLKSATTGTLTWITDALTSSAAGSYYIDANYSRLTAKYGNYVFVQAAGNATAMTLH